MEFKAAVINDLQIPYHDPDALDVATQIIRDFQPEVVDLNGDIFDFLNLSRWSGVRTQLNESTAIEFESEIERGVEIVNKFVAEVKPERIHWKNGNHEFRLLRAIANADAQAKKILELKVVRAAYSYPSLFRFEEMGTKVVFAGEYPNGSLIHPGLPTEQNVWIEHGYVARKKSGFTANALMEERMCSVICGHCEKLAGPLWRQVNGGRTFFAIENGNLSLLGVPGLGDGQYFGVPHSVPGYMNHTQGLSLLVHTGGHWYPQTVRIVAGQAYWNGKLYKSRVSKQVNNGMVAG